MTKSRTEKCGANNQRVTSVVRELVRMWQPHRKRDAALEEVAKDLGISARLARDHYYESAGPVGPHELRVIEFRRRGAWRRLADYFREMAEYCDAMAEEPSVKHEQKVLVFGGATWTREKHGAQRGRLAA